jgi:uncharacterized repeat protein (TIGR03803 family)
VLHSFNNDGRDGYYPAIVLVLDAAGNLYGTTGAGGAHSDGLVFELERKPEGGWAEKTLHAFNDNGKDGSYPSAGLIFDAAGNLYGTTDLGGTYGYGAIFELTPGAGGRWTETILHSFNDDGTDGILAAAGLILDSAGNLYGTTSGGGAYSYGTAFELAPAAGGGWTETILHNFDDNGADGVDPSVGLTLDSASNFYGTTQVGGTGVCSYNSMFPSCGTVFEIQAAVSECALPQKQETADSSTLPSLSLRFWPE